MKHNGRNNETKRERERERERERVVLNVLSPQNINWN